MRGVYGNTKARRTDGHQWRRGGAGVGRGRVPDGCERGNNIAGRLIERAGSFLRHGARLDATASNCSKRSLCRTEIGILFHRSHAIFGPRARCRRSSSIVIFFFFTYQIYVTRISTVGVNYNILMSHVSFVFGRIDFVHTAIEIDATIAGPRFQNINVFHLKPMFAFLKNV